MPLTIPADIGKGLAHMPKLGKILKATQSDLKLTALKVAVVAGGDGGSTVTGIATADTLIAVTNLTDETLVDATISAANTITYTGDLSGKNLQVIYLDVSALET